MSETGRGFVQAALLVAIVAAPTFSEAQTDQRSGTAPGMTYESLAQLPDLSGWWYWHLEPTALPLPFLGAP